MVIFISTIFLRTVLSGCGLAHIHTHASIKKDTLFFPTCQILLYTEWSFTEKKVCLYVLYVYTHCSCYAYIIGHYYTYVLFWSEIAVYYL